MSYGGVSRLYGLEAGNKIAAFNWDNLRIANNVRSICLVVVEVGPLMTARFGEVR